MRALPSLSVLALSSLAMVASAQEALPPVRLDGPEVARLAWDTRSIVAGDFDQDGKQDVALINNENAKLVLLYQRAPGSPALTTGQRAVSRDRWEPQLEDSRFQKVSLPADQRHFAMAAGDFDGDGRPDLALTGAADALSIRFQGATAGFSQTWTYRNFEPLQGTRTLVAADLDQDGKTDLAVLAKNKLLIFKQRDAGQFADPVVYLTTEEKAGYLMAEDVDGDMAPDLLYLAGSGEGTLRLRLQTSPGAFASEMSLAYQIPAAGVTSSRDGAGQLVLNRVNAKSRLIERHTLVMKAPGAIQQDKLLPTLHAPPGGVSHALHALGDFNGDALTDIAQADGKTASIALYLQQADGSFAEPQSFPSLSGINGLAAVQPVAGQPHQLIVTSAKEGLGVCRLSGTGRLEFPVLQPLDGTPAGVVPVRLPGGISLPVVRVDKEKAWSMQLFSPGTTGPWTGTMQSLKALKREPTGLRTGDLNGDGRDDLLVLLPKDPALVLLARNDAPGFADPLKETPAFKAQLSDLTPERTALFDLNNDGRAEILTAAPGYARTLRLNADETDLIIVDQCNARSPADKLTVPVLADIDADGTPELLFQESGTAFWQVLQKDPAGVWRSTRRLEADPSDASAALVLPLGKPARPHLIALGKDRFWTAPLSGSRPVLTLTGSYETDLRNCSYYQVLPTDLNHDGQPEIVALDANSKLLEVLHPGGITGEGWKSLLHFVLFEENIHFRGRKGEDNVREMLTGDFTGDQKSDLLLLVHDRILLFPQG